MNKKLLGFTLSELLIAVGIIGIVAALTVPTLYNNYQRKVSVLKLEKVYTEFLQVMDLFIVESPTRDIYRSKLSLRGKTASADNINNTAGWFLREHFKVTAECKDSLTPCFANQYKSINAATDGAITCVGGYTVSLSNGAAVCLIPANDNTPANVLVDTNGNKSPNFGGVDVFSFQIYQDGSIDEGVTPTDRSDNKNLIQIRENNFNSYCQDSRIGRGCFGKLINDKWVMNYNK